MWLLYWTIIYDLKIITLENHRGIYLHWNFQRIILKTPLYTFCILEGRWDRWKIYKNSALSSPLKYAICINVISCINRAYNNWISSNVNVDTSICLYTKCYPRIKWINHQTRFIIKRRVSLALLRIYVAASSANIIKRLPTPILIIIFPIRDVTHLEIPIGAISPDTHDSPAIIRRREKRDQSALTGLH